MSSRVFKISFYNLSDKYAFSGWGTPFYEVPDLPGNIRVVHTPKPNLEVTGDQTTLWITQEAPTPADYGMLVRYYNAEANMYFGLRIVKAFQLVIGGAVTWSTVSNNSKPHDWRDQNPQAGDHVWQNAFVTVTAVPALQEDDYEIEVTIRDVQPLT